MSFLQVDLGAVRPVTRFVVKHASAGGENEESDTRDFNIQVSKDGKIFATVASSAGTGFVVERIEFRELIYFDGRREAAVFSELYNELARKFAKLVEVLNEVSEGMSGADQSMLRLYDRWLKTGSDRMHRILVEKGIVPNTTVKRTFQ